MAKPPKTPPKIHEVAIARMKSLGWSGRTLAWEVRGQVGRTAIHNFLNGKSIRAERLDAILAALGLIVVPDPKSEAWFRSTNGGAGPGTAHEKVGGREVNGEVPSR